ncbi:MAG: Xaa-Pro peptidase family protein [Desulfatirhabdiaceae bacterium]
MTHPEINHTPSSELTARFSRLQHYLQENHIDSVLIAQPVDLFYFAGTLQQSFLFVPNTGQPLLMVRKSLERASQESALPHITGLSNPKHIPDLIRRHGLSHGSILGLELDVIPAQLYIRIQQLFEGVKIRDVSHIIRTVRSIKSEYEQNKIRRSAELGDQVFEYARGVISEGMTEVELAGIIEAHARKLGHQGLVRMRLYGSELFYGHLMTGAGATTPSYLSSPTGGEGLSPAIAQGPGFNRIKAHEPILVDYVFAFEGYLSDQTRIFCIGELPDDLTQAHQDMLRLQNILMKAIKPGITAGSIYDQAIDLSTQWGYGDNFMGVGGETRIRFVGHGLGLELDEYPFLAKGQSSTVEENMVIALEPKLIFPDKGVVGIENTHLVTTEGLLRMTRFEDGVIQV